MGVVACTNLPTLTPPLTPTSTPTPTRTSITLELEVKSNPREAADIVLNPKPIPGGRYLLGRTVTINVLPKEGWQVDEWVGPVYGIAGKTAEINMTSNQTVIIRMVRFETALQSPVPVPPTPTLIPTLPTSVPPTPTSEPAPAPRPTPTLRVRAAPAPTAAPREHGGAADSVSVSEQVGLPGQRRWPVKFSRWDSRRRGWQRLRRRQGQPPGTEVRRRRPVLTNVGV